MSNLIKGLSLIETSHGYDMVVERDAGNKVRILTGNKSKVYWEHLKILAEEALGEIALNEERLKEARA